MAGMSMHGINKSLYGDLDLRSNIYEVDALHLSQELTQRVKKQSESVACLVSSRYFNKQNDNTYSIAPEIPTLRRAKNLGEMEKFGNEPVLSYATAFLIGKRLALTAGHCVCVKTNDFTEERLKSSVLVFGYQMIANNQTKRTFDQKDIYRIDNIVAHRLEKPASKICWNDWAVLVLDREVEGREPFALNFSNLIADKIRIYMLGHPSGLPLKFTRNAEVQEIKRHYFEANLDAFAGNSGSPVFKEATGEIVGILCEGNLDYEVDENYRGTGERRTVARRIPPADIQAKGFEKCQLISDLSFLQATFSSLNALPPAAQIDDQRLVAGLNLEGQCSNQDCRISNRWIVIPLGFGTFSLNKTCAETPCPECKKDIPPTSVNSIIISSCMYQIEGRKNQEYVYESFRLLKKNAGIRLNVSQWNYIQLHVNQL